MTPIILAAHRNNYEIVKVCRCIVINVNKCFTLIIAKNERIQLFITFIVQVYILCK